MQYDELRIVLEKAWDESINFDKSIQKEVEFADQIKFLLIESTHKTYKYILINGLLGASAGNNPLCLQKGSNLPNAWDARSLCHKVLVPFEREFMNNRLGGSNEPFLNKPARFVELSDQNAVRAGKDRKALMALIEIFGHSNINAISINLLKFSLHIVRQIKVSEIINIQNDCLTEKLFTQLLSKPCNGESLLFVSGFLLNLIYEKHVIKCHPSNQSGASSKEVGDIDIFLDDTLVSSVEVKDKLFSVDDCQHAENKCLTKNIKSFLFISRQNYINNFIKNHNKKITPKYLVSIESLQEIALPLVNNSFSAKLNDYSVNFIKCARPKEATLNHINAILKHYQ